MQARSSHIIVLAVCGQGDTLQLLDLGNGSTLVVLLRLPIGSGYYGLCTQALYPTGCGGFAGNLGLSVIASDTFTYTPPDFQKCLATLGLAGINYVRNLAVEVNNDELFPLPARNFDFGLSNVQVVDKLQIAETTPLDRFLGAQGLEVRAASLSLSLSLPLSLSLSLSVCLSVSVYDRDAQTHTHTHIYADASCPRVWICWRTLSGIVPLTDNHTSCHFTT